MSRKIARKRSQKRPAHLQDEAAPTRLPCGDAGAFWKGSDLLAAAALVVAVFLAYLPCWDGKPVWDDDMHITRVELRSAHGLYRIWTDVGATSQYYPLLHTAFWLEHAVWGDLPLGYHLVNLTWHATAAVLLYALLRRLKVPGARLAAAIFALHPVQVESVAWITEQKNTLSAVFYLAAALAYLRFDRVRQPAWYAASAALFLLALLTKTVTGTLPAALLIVLWWRRGRLSLKNDVLPLAPLLLLGAAFAAITAYWELSINRCTGPDFDFSFVERLLIAGRTSWFCCAKLIWPANLTFSYPRWQIDGHVAWQYVYPAAALAVVGIAWALRRRSRGPLAAVLYYGGTLFPVLGFFSLYTFRYSFVADHYQYLACAGPIALASAAVATLLEPVPVWQRVAGWGSCLILLLVLAALTWRQSENYADARTLYEATIIGNPDCWMAYNNLGQELAARRDFVGAVENYQKAMQIKSDFAEPHINLGMLLADRGQYNDALGEYRAALAIDPASFKAHNNMGMVFAQQKRLPEAIAEFKAALDIDPDCAVSHSNLGHALVDSRQYEAAIAEYERALQITPDDEDAQRNLSITRHYALQAGAKRTTTQ